MFKTRQKSYKKLIATVGSCEVVYNQTEDPAETFCERGDAGKRTDDYCIKKTKQSELCFDVVQVTGLELLCSCEHMDLNHARLPIPPRAHILKL